VLTGELAAVAPVIRIVRKLDNINRVHTGQRTRKERGMYRATMYGLAPKVKSALRC
jgi:hypothetical protein